MAFVIGLTGGIASGKTTVANLFKQQFKIDIVDADIVAREVVEPGTPGLNAIVEHFGADIVRDDQTLDRAKLREQIFSNPDEKAWLNALLHPMIREKMIEDLEQVESVCATGCSALNRKQAIACVIESLWLMLNRKLKSQER